MNIVLFTTSLPEEVFDECQKHGIKKNPAGQNFYLRLQKALGTFAECHVLTFDPGFPFSTKNKKASFVKREKSRRKTAKNIYLAYSKIAARLKPDFFLCDSLNLLMSKAARKLAKRHHVPLIFVLTDAPSNITGASLAYRFLCHRYARNARAYIALTEGLNYEFNVKKKPYITFPGIVDPIEPLLPVVSGDYYYYGGALFEKDGVGSLIRAYLASETKIPLYIAGHGAMEKEIEELASKHENLHFMGQISRKDNAAMEQHALCLINPRWYKRSLDDVSVPSKNLEYLSLGHRVVSTPSHALSKDFKTEVFWLPEDKTKMEIKLTRLFEDKFDKVPLCKAGPRIQRLYGIEALGKRLLRFLSSL